MTANSYVTSAEIEAQYDYAKANGWLPTFLKCAADYDWPPEILMAIASRETNMRNIVGDGGHGYGVMQIDSRSFPDFTHSGAWHDPLGCIEKGCQVLESKRTEAGRGIGKSLTVGGSHFVGSPFANQVQLNRVAIAAYNCGLWAYYNFSTGKHPVDAFTTGHDYSEDVIARAVEFAKLLELEQNAAAPSA